MAEDADRSALIESEARRDEGIAHALVGAENRETGFAARAHGFLFAYARSHESFTTEDVRAFCANAGDVDARAWGGIMKYGERRGWIRADGYQLVNCSNRSPRVRWRSQVMTT